MPPHTFHPSARILYVFTALVAMAVIGTVGFAGAGQPEAQCKGNSPKKVCPTVQLDDGATVSGVVTVSAQIEETVASISFMVDDVASACRTRPSPTRPAGTRPRLRTARPQGHGRGRDREVLGPRAPRRRLQRDDATAAPGRHRALSVALTSPAAGATVWSVSVAADASDNVGVVGVQFKVDGANVGSEDEPAVLGELGHHSVGNGNHTLGGRPTPPETARPQQRTVTVWNTSSPPPPTGDTTAPTVD